MFLGEIDLEEKQMAAPDTKGALMTNSNQTKTLLRVGEVAAMLDLGVSTIWRQVRKGQIPAPIQIGGSTRWRAADIQAMLEPQKAA
jgi:excisionase family DNA binding protein